MTVKIEKAWFMPHTPFLPHYLFIETCLFEKVQTWKKTCRATCHVSVSGRQTEKGHTCHACRAGQTLWRRWWRGRGVTTVAQKKEKGGRWDQEKEPHLFCPTPSSSSLTTINSFRFPGSLFFLPFSFCFGHRVGFTHLHTLAWWSWVGGQGPYSSPLIPPN